MAEAKALMADVKGLMADAKALVADVKALMGREWGLGWWLRPRIRRKGIRGGGSDGSTQVKENPTKGSKWLGSDGREQGERDPTEIEVNRQ